MNTGKIGERLFMQRMREQGYTVLDVSTNADYWSKDIDFIITSPTTKRTRTFEVKWDQKINRTGNLYLELTNIHSKGGQGWFQFCEADYLAYGDSAGRKFYIISLLELRQKIKQLPQRYAKCGQDSEGLLVSLNDIQDIVQGCIYV